MTPKRWSPPSKHQKSPNEAPARGSRYFGVAAIGRDQAADYASRKGMSLEEAERWLAPNLAYDPAE